MEGTTAFDVFAKNNPQSLDLNILWGSQGTGERIKGHLEGAV